MEAAYPGRKDCIDALNLKRGGPRLAVDVLVSQKSENGNGLWELTSMPRLVWLMGRGYIP
jgi:hypothetical protein